VAVADIQNVFKKTLFTDLFVEIPIELCIFAPSRGSIINLCMLYWLPDLDPDPDPLVLKPFGRLVHQSKKFFKLVCSMRGTLKKR
jgi:hypothetical protein